MDVFSDDTAKKALELVGPNIGIIASKFSNAIVEKKITPNIIKIISDNSEREKTLNSIIEYFQMSYSSNASINTIVFKGNPKCLKELYIPLTIIKIADENDKFILSEENVEFNKIFESYPKMMIVDKAGMGKSTIVKFLMLMALEKGDPIPICIELRKLNENTDVLDLLTSEINLFNGKATKEQIKRLILEDQFLIFLDGYDEIREKDKIKVTLMLQNFIRQTPNVYYLLTSRDENALDSFVDFNRFMIKPLSIEEAFLLIKKYDNDGEVSKLLIEKISSDNQFNSLKEFLTNPLLVSLLYKTFQYREEIPYKKLVFYDTVFEALFNDHDLTKGGAYIHEKKTNLDICDFRKIARGLGWRTLCLDKFEFSLDELSKEIEMLLHKYSFINLKAADIIQDLLKSVPLFAKEGNNYKWVHKSFMEYFAACYIHHDLETNKKKIILEKMTLDNNNINKYENLLDFYFEIDDASFDKYIIAPFLEKFINTYKKKYTQSNFINKDENYIKLRRSIDSLVNVELWVTKKNNFQDKIKSREENLFMGLVVPISNNLFANMFLFKKNGNESLLGIIDRKKVDIFFSSEIIKFVKRNDLNKIANDLFDKQIYVNDDLNNEINDDENFYNMSDLIFYMMKTGVNYWNYCLDIDKCQKYVDSIEHRTKMETLEIEAFIN